MEQESLNLYKPISENSKKAILESISGLQELLEGYLLTHVRDVYTKYLQQLTKLIEDDMLWMNYQNK